MHSWSDEFLGRVSGDASDYCSAACLRALPGLTCCSPQAPEAIGARFLLFLRDSSAAAALDLSWREANGAVIAQLAQSLPDLVVVSHGWLEEPAPDSPDPQSRWMFAVKDAYLARGKAAVMLVDWSGGKKGHAIQGNGIDYAQSAANVRTVGMMIGRLLLDWKIEERALLLGFSLGAHVVSQAGKYVQAHGKQARKVKECHALDPAGESLVTCSSD